MRWMVVAILVGCGGPATEGSCDDCDPATQYCEHQGTDVADEPSVLSCQDLPAACDPASCDCLVGSAVDFCLEYGSCEVDELGLVTVFCPGG